MSSEEILSSPLTTSEEVDNSASSESVPNGIEESSEIETSSEVEESSETETSSEVEESVETETETEVIYQVADLTKIEESLEIITCFVIIFSVYMVGVMVYKLVKDIFI